MLKSSTLKHCSCSVSSGCNEWQTLSKTCLVPT